MIKKSQLTALQKDVAQKRERKKELEPYIKRVDELERRRNELAKKNYAIEELRSQRTIPVHILDEVSRAVPEYLWLTKMNLKGAVLSIDGETLQEQAIPTFHEISDASQFIGTPRLIETKQKTTTANCGGKVLHSKFRHRLQIRLNRNHRKSKNTAQENNT